MNLSIIVPVFNGEKTIKHCLMALKRELMPSDEIIVVDDFSTDNTVEIVRELSCTQVKLLRVERNQGQGACRNKGVALANGNSQSIFVFIDSDIEVKSGSLEVIRDSFNNDESLSAITGIISLDHPYSNFFSLYKNTYMNLIFSDLPRDVSFLYGGVCAIRCEDFIKWPHFDLLGEDTQLGLMLSSQGKKIELVKELEVIHHKFYSLSSIVKNDFLIPFGFAKSFIFFIEQVSVGNFKIKSSQFSHVSLKQLMCLLFTSVGFVLLLSSHKGTGAFFSIILILVSCVINSSFLIKLRDIHGTVFALKSLVWTLVDQLVMTCGAFFGLIYHGKIRLFKKIHKEKVENFRS